jgi:hypothetical protein
LHFSGCIIFMAIIDEWGKDPAVKTMRKIFRAVDDAQREFFDHLEISRYDPRIRPWRERALVLFEKTFFKARRAGVTVNEEVASNIYLNCLAKVMMAQGIEIPETYLPDPIFSEE